MEPSLRRRGRLLKGPPGPGARAGRSGPPGEGEAGAGGSAGSSGPAGEVVEAHAEGTLVRVRVVPGARRTEVAGVIGAALRLRVAAPPVEGKANAAVLAYLAGRVGLRPRDLRIAAGERSRDKLVVIRGLGPDQVRPLLLPPAPDPPRR